LPGSQKSSRKFTANPNPWAEWYLFSSPQLC
jgi:hypothetical protein